MKHKKFIRQDYWRHSRLGKKRKKLQKWRGAKGRDSKIRMKRKGYPIAPTVGYKRSKKISGKVNEKFPILVKNTKELESLKNNQIPILARIGARKKIEMIKRAAELKISFLNVKEAK